MFLLLTLNIFTPFSDFPFFDFEQVNVWVCSECCKFSKKKILQSFDTASGYSTTTLEQIIQLAFTCSKSTMETDVVLVSLFLTLSRFHTFFFLSGFSFTDTDNSQDSRGREGTIFYSTLPLPPAHEHWDIYLQLCMWDDYHVFLIATLVFTRLLLDEIYHLIELLFDWLIWYIFSLLACWIDFI